MRFVHAADIHLDSPLRNLALPEPHQLDKVRRATREAFQALVELCIAREAKLLILAGDLWDGDAQNVKTGLFFRSQLARLERAGVIVIIKKGNHDAQNRITGALDLPANTRIFDHRRPESFSLDDLGVVVHGQSFPPGKVTQNLAATYPPPVPGRLNIGVLHTSLAGGNYHDPYAPCRLEDLTSKGYAYWALGHIHKAAIHSRDPWVVYPGNLQGRDIRETGPKGCVVVDAEGDRIVNVEPVAVDVVRWHETVVDIAGIGSEGDFQDAVRTGLVDAHRGAEGRPCAVRVSLTGAAPFSASLARRPQWLRQIVLETAAEIDPDLWIEEVRDQSSLPAAPALAAASRTDTADLDQVLAEIAASPEDIAEILKSELAALRTKLPDSLKSHPALAAAEEAAALREAAERVLPRLAARLSGEAS